jgi:hypothetical protein
MIAQTNNVLEQNVIVQCESQFDSELFRVPAIVWPVELWDGCEQSQLKKQNGKLLL